MNGIRRVDGGGALFYSSGMAKKALEKTVVPVDDLHPAANPAPRFPDLPASFAVKL